MSFFMAILIGVEVFWGREDVTIVA